MNQPQAAHWNFIVALYEKPEIKDTCLALQNIGGVDVTVLLAAIYATAELNIPLDHKDITKMDSLASPLRENYILPLRAMRMKLKGSSSNVEGSDLQTLYEKILEAELLTEREQLALLNHYIASRLSRSTNSDISATVELVCNFYFKKNHIPEYETRQLKLIFPNFSRALSSQQQ